MFVLIRIEILLINIAQVSVLHVSKTNPTELNGVPLTPNPVVLSHNDELKFGERIFRIEYGKNSPSFHLKLHA